MENSGSSEMKLKCAICGKRKKRDEFEFLQYIIENTDANEVTGYWFGICHECLKKIREEDDRELIEDGWPL